MSFKSEAQKAKFAQLLKEKKISQKVYDEWSAGTKGKLPERVGRNSKDYAAQFDEQSARLRKRFGLK